MPDEKNPLTYMCVASAAIMPADYIPDPRSRERILVDEILALDLIAPSEETKQIIENLIADYGRERDQEGADDYVRGEY